MPEDILGPKHSSIISEAARQGTRHENFSTCVSNKLFVQESTGWKSLLQIDGAFRAIKTSRVEFYTKATDVDCPYPVLVWWTEIFRGEPALQDFEGSL